MRAQSEDRPHVQHGWSMLLFGVVAIIVVVLTVKYFTQPDSDGGLLAAIVVLTGLLVLVQRIPDVTTLQLPGLRSAS